MNLNRRILPQFPNYQWDTVEKRLFSGFDFKRETKPENGRFRLKKKGVSHYHTSEELDRSIGVVDDKLCRSLENKVYNQKKKVLQ